MDVMEKIVDLLQDDNNPIWKLFLNNAETMRIADYLVSNGATVQQFISVEDRLPDETGRYLAVKKRIAPDELGGNRTDIVILRFFVDNGFKIPEHIPDWINKEINEEVTHWMPLPKMPQPPKGE